MSAARFDVTRYVDNGADAMADIHRAESELGSYLVHSEAQHNAAPDHRDLSCLTCFSQGA